MKLQTDATKVAQRTSALLRVANSRTPSPAIEPIWYRVVLSNPPTHQLLPRLRQLETQLEQDRYRYNKSDIDSRGFFVTRNKQKLSTSAKHLYRIPKLQYAEDRIRHIFYTNHPWEMARPRNMVENGGPAPSNLDWSTIYQPAIKLSGECVVQRTLWLSKQSEYQKKHGSDWFAAYEQARVEFYRLRMREFAESQVAQEEALMHGAMFGPSSWDSFVTSEQRYIDKYVGKATEASKEMLAKRRQVVDDEPDAPSELSQE